MLTTALCILMLIGTLCLPTSATDSEPVTVKVGVSGGMTPLLFVSDDGQVLGAFADMMSYIAEGNNYDIEYVRFRQQVECLTALENGDVDVVLGVYSEKVSAYSSLIMSRELYAASLCVASGKKKPSYSEDLYGSFEMNSIPYHLYGLLEVNQFLILPNQDAVIASLITGRSGRIIALRDCIFYGIEHSGFDNDFTISTSNVGYLNCGIALNQSNLILNSRINGSIMDLRNSSQYDSIMKKWNIQTEIEAANIRTAKLMKVIGGMVIAAALTVLMFSFFNIRLRSMVREKTSELSEKVKDLERAGSLRNTLIEQSSAGSMVLRLDGTILLMNDAMRKLAGIPDDGAVTNIAELGAVGRVWELAPPEMDNPELFTERGDDGQLRTYRYQNHRAANHDERVFIIEDITREEMEKQEVFEESKNKALNRIIAGIAHEIKNPLMTIKTYASLAKAQGGDPEFLGAFTEYVPKEVDRISRLVETLVNYSRPVHGQKERFCVAEVADSCLGLAYVTAKKNIKMENDIDRSLYISTNKDQFRQALVNFLINSIESIEVKVNAGNCETGMVKLSVYRMDSDVCTEVYDTGVGMNAEQLQQCAEPFFTTKKKGTGMGLALAKQYTKENGGRFEVESSEGEYTYVRMIFAEDTTND